MSNPFVHEKRCVFTPLRRAKIYARQDGQCAKCTRTIPHADDWDVDHIIPLSRGGTNDDDNLQALCSWCHDNKTEGDLSGAAKDKRVYANHVVPSRFRRSRSWGRR